MMSALDLFCCAGGASYGIAEAGFTVHGIDVEHQAEYPPYHPFSFERRPSGWGFRRELTS